MSAAAAAAAAADDGSQAKYSLTEDGFVIIPLSVQCAFRDKNAFFEYLSSLPELDLASAGVRSVADLVPGHFGDDPRGILPFASTFHHVFNRDLRLIAYLHAVPYLFMHKEEEEEGGAGAAKIEQLYDGFSVRGPGKRVPHRSARPAKMTVPYKSMQRNGREQKLCDAALEDAVELTSSSSSSSYGAALYFGDDSMDFESTRLERRFARSEAFGQQGLYTGWINLSFPVFDSSKFDDPEYIDKLQSMNQFLAYIPGSHLRRVNDNDDDAYSMTREDEEEDDEEEIVKRVVIPPNCMVLIHPRLKTELTAGVIRQSFSVRQYVSFRVTSSSSSLFPSSFRELVMRQMRVPFLPSGHRPCVFRIADFETQSSSRHFTDKMRSFMSVLSPSFRCVYLSSAAHSHYVSLEMNQQEIAPIDMSSNESVPPKILTHLLMEDDDDKVSTSFFGRYTSLDRLAAWKLKSLSTAWNEIASGRLPARCEELLMRRPGFAHFAKQFSAPAEEQQEEEEEVESDYDDDDDEDLLLEEEEEDDTSIRGGLFRRRQVQAPPQKRRGQPPMTIQQKRLQQQRQQIRSTLALRWPNSSDFLVLRRRRNRISKEANNRSKPAADVMTQLAYWSIYRSTPAQQLHFTFLMKSPVTTPVSSTPIGLFSIPNLTS